MAVEQEVIPPQFPGGGPMVCVRNTFIDLDDGPPAPSALERARTAPVYVQAASEHEEEEEEDEEEEEAEDAPPAPEIRRETTFDTFEHSQQWQWRDPASGGALGLSTVAEGAMPPAEGWQQAAPPIIWMPVAMPVMPVAMPVAMASDLGGQGVQFASPEWPGGPLQPATLNRGLRWPDELAALPEVPAADAAAAPDSPSAASDGLPPPQPQTLTRTFSVQSRMHRVHWTVDARKLRGTDKQAVSPPFELSFGESFPSVTFKMILCPQVNNQGKGGASFKKAKGKGFMQLKCEAELSGVAANVSFRISIGSKERQEEPCPSVRHNFSSSAVCAVKDLLDFASVVDSQSQTFVVCMEIMPSE